jgi:precorrin-2 dehydrogenase/sirohydrochlorin ferrochelatase
VRYAYPLMLDVSERLIIIIGGGSVAARKAKGVLDAGATRIRMIAPDFCGDIPDPVERITEPYNPRHLEGAGLVFAATDNPEVNAAVVRDAHRLGLLVSRADSAEEDAGDFATPAVLREDDLVVTVSAGGSPALAAAVRDQLRLRIDVRWATMARAMKILRPRALAITSVETRRNALRDMVTPAAMEVLDKEGVDALWDWLRRRHLKEQT